MGRKRGKRLKKKGLDENSSFKTIGAEKKSMKKKNKNKNKKKALLVLNTSFPSSSNLRLTPTQVVASTSLLFPSEKKEVNESRTKRREKYENKPGYIFLCNRETKPECYRYRIFGLPRGKLDVVKNIEPGMKLFLYDFDVKFLYGVYEATSMGALDLEPSAFNGLFPAQVKFNILKDSLPLPESTFRHVIKDNYQGGNKFKQELTPIQVKSLISLFRDIVVTPSAPTVSFLSRPIALPIVEEGARFSPSENLYSFKHHYIPTGLSLDTRSEHLVQHRERNPDRYRTYVEPSMMEEKTRFSPSINSYFSRRHCLPTRPSHDTETEQVVRHRECGSHEYQTYVSNLQHSVESKHVIQSDAVYHDKSYYIDEAYQPYVPKNPRLHSPDPYKRNLTLMNPRDQDIGRHRIDSNYYSANLAGERKLISPINYDYSSANFARERQQPLHLDDYLYPHDYDYDSQHLHPTTSSVSVAAHGAHPQPDLKHAPPNGSCYTVQNSNLLHGGMTQRTALVSYGDVSEKVSSRYTLSGVAPSYQ